MKQDTDFDWESRIAIDPNVLGGKPVIKGRRVALQYIVGALAAGESYEEVCRHFSITKGDILAALAYATYALEDEVVHALPRR